MKAALIIALSLAGSALTAPSARQGAGRITAEQIRALNQLKKEANTAEPKCNKEHILCEQERGQAAFETLLGQEFSKNIPAHVSNLCRKEPVPPGCFVGDEAQEGCVTTQIEKYADCTAKKSSIEEQIRVINNLKKEANKAEGKCDKEFVECEEKRGQIAFDNFFGDNQCGKAKVDPGCFVGDEVQEGCVIQYFESFRNCVQDGPAEQESSCKAPGSA